MSDYRSKDKDRPQEAADNKKMPKDMNENEATDRSGAMEYDDWSTERLHSEARERNIKGYQNMDRRGLIHSIFGTGSG